MSLELSNSVETVQTCLPENHIHFPTPTANTRSIMLLVVVHDKTKRPRPRSDQNKQLASSLLPERNVHIKRVNGGNDRPSVVCLQEAVTVPLLSAEGDVLFEAVIGWHRPSLCCVPKGTSPLLWGY
eukprot:3687410-Amphidinium_carterae.1